MSIIGNTIISSESFFLCLRGTFIQTKSEFGSPYFVYCKQEKKLTLIFVRNIIVVVKNTLSECKSSSKDKNKLDS